MSSRIRLALLCIILLIHLLVGAVVWREKADFDPNHTSIITINPPLTDEIYNSSSVRLNVDDFGLYPWDSDNITSLSYCLDGQKGVPLTFTSINGDAAFKANATLDVSYGLHNLYAPGLSIRNHFDEQEKEPNNVIVTAIVVLTIVEVLIVIVTNTKKVRRFMKPMPRYGF